MKKQIFTYNLLFAFIIFLGSSVITATSTLTIGSPDDLHALSTQQALDTLKLSNEDNKNHATTTKEYPVLKTPLIKKESTPHADNNENNSTAQDYFNLAETYKEEGNLEQAITYYLQTLQLEPTHFKACFYVANAFFQTDKISQAIQYYQNALHINPKSATVHLNLGICTNRLKKHQEALNYFKTSIELNPSYVKGYLHYGATLEKLGNNKEALEVYQHAITNIDPNNSDLLYRAGMVLRHLNRIDEAIEYFHNALHFNPKNTNVMLQLANTLNMIMTPEAAQEALELYYNVLEINPDTKEAMYNFAYTLKKLGHIRKAKNILIKILEKYPDYPQAHFSLSLCHLTLGNFKEGWKEYEWRWNAYHEQPKKLNKPLWNGSDPRGKRILIYAEQGLGDTLQFIRYAQLLKKRGAIVIVETQEPLFDLLSQCDYIDHLVVRGKTLPDFDFQIALMSLPRLFETTLETVPTNIPYLKADPKLVEYWKEQLAHDTNFKIGICWQGNSQYRTQFLRQVVAAKSMNVKTFEPLGNLTGVSLYSLQKINGVDQLEGVNETIKIHTFGPDFDESHGRFMDTAAVMKNLDLVITIDTSIAHLAGGLNIPVWNLLPEPCDWRWMINCNDSPWYPNMRLFRQSKQGDWESVIKTIVQELKLCFPDCTSQKICTRSQKEISEFSQKQYDIADIVDDITLHSIEPERPTTFTNEDTLQAYYTDMCTHVPELKMLTDHLTTINQRLLDLEKKFHSSQHSILDQTFINLAYEAYFITKLKNIIKKEISRAINPR